MSKFCRRSNMDRYKLQLLLANYRQNPTEDRERQLQKIIEKSKEFASQHDSRDISDDERKVIFSYIKEHYGKIQPFARAHKLKPETIYNIVSGLTRRKGKVFKKIINICKREP